MRWFRNVQYSEALDLVIYIYKEPEAIATKQTTKHMTKKAEWGNKASRGVVNDEQMTE